MELFLYDNTTVISNIYAAKRRNSLAKLLNQEKNDGHLDLWRHV